MRMIVKVSFEFLYFSDPQKASDWVTEDHFKNTKLEKIMLLLETLPEESECYRKIEAIFANRIAVIKAGRRMNLFNHASNPQIKSIIAKSMALREVEVTL